jgi:adenylate kinase
MSTSAADPRLVILGKQGAGKGTQAARLADRYAIRHISTGDMFREQAARGTALGLEAERFMDRGELVPDEIVIGVVEASLVEGGPLANGFVLDGFPRTLDQARELDRVLGTEEPIDLAIDLKVPREVVLDRIAIRRVREERDDDTQEAVERRLELYERETVPIFEYYARRGVLATVDGVGESDEVFDRLVHVVSERLPHPRG